jgi:putative endopeptidase
MRLTLSTLLCAALAACGGSQPQHIARPPTAGATSPTPAEPAALDPVATVPQKPVTNRTLAQVGLDPDALDKTVDPCDDFYQFACGGWIAETEIPADKPLAMRSFVAIDDRNVDYEHDLLERARRKPADLGAQLGAADTKLKPGEVAVGSGTDPITEKLGAYYGSCMDEAAIEKQGLRPIKPVLDVIAGVKDDKSLTHAVAVLQTQGIATLFSVSPTQDFADARNVIVSIDQAGLGLPDRDYYLQDSDQMKQARDAYQKFMVQTLTIAGQSADEAKRHADAIMVAETEIAKVSKDKVAMRDPKGIYNKIDRTGIAKAMPHFGWDQYWKTIGLKDVKDATTSSPQFLQGLDEVLQSTSPEVWRSYLIVHVLDKAAHLLTKRMDDTKFKLTSTLSGQTEQEPRWKRCVRYTGGALGDLLGQAFVRDKFPGASKEAAEQAVHAIVDAMSKNLAALPWMDAATKQKAAAKLTAMAYQIGYPKKWKSYAFAVDAKEWAKNAFAADRAELARQLAKIGRPVDKDDWEMSVPTVNAYYTPLLNTMVFPAGILQPPFYNVDAGVAVNLGAMGMVVGHEMTHGFDDEGAQFDPDGNLRDWWQPETAKQFKARTQCVIAQYSDYESDGNKLNGAHTVGENIADIGGVKLALAGYRALRSSAPDTVVADGFTEDQQFFLSFAQAWCQKAKPEYVKRQVVVDPHSPAHWRVDGALSATPDFAKAWSCKAGKKMLPKQQCVVW